MEGDDQSQSLYDDGVKFLPTPSHGGRLDQIQLGATVHAISTHALTWRATASGFQQIDCGSISTHALTWRATLPSFTFVPDASISTHALTWRATLAYPILSSRIHISTHALTWRATICPDCLAEQRKISTHALTWRATCRCRRPSAGLRFLPTPSHGGRLKHTSILPHFCYFYPRPHMEGDAVFGVT